MSQLSQIGVDPSQGVSWPDPSPGPVHPLCHGRSQHLVDRAPCGQVHAGRFVVAIITSGCSGLGTSCTAGSFSNGDFPVEYSVSPGSGSGLKGRMFLWILRRR